MLDNAGLGILGNSERDIKNSVKTFEKQLDNSLMGHLKNGPHFKKGHLMYYKMMMLISSEATKVAEGRMYKENTNSIKNSPSIELI